MKIIINNRHKAGLFLTTISAGLCLLLGESFHETIGAVIIGFALTWAFGSASRVLRTTIGAAGALICALPFLAALNDHHNALRNYEKRLEIFRSKLPDFAEAHPDLEVGLHLPPGAILDLTHTEVDDPYACYAVPVSPNAFKTLAVPNTGKIALPCTASDKDIAKALRASQDKILAPSWYLEALDAGVSPNWINELTPPLDKPEAFNTMHVISDGSIIEIPSAILAVLFLSSVIVEVKRFTGTYNRVV